MSALDGLIETYEMRTGNTTRAAREELTQLRAELEKRANQIDILCAALAAKTEAVDDANNLIVELVNQACIKTVKKTGTTDIWIHSFMSTYEGAFEYLVKNGLAKYCENGVDICDLYGGTK